MIYHVRAMLRIDTAESLLAKLSNGTIGKQQPDGPEIVASMERAVVNENGEIEWSEMCLCPSPLHHERATVLDVHFKDIVTELIDAHATYEGESFLNYLKDLC
jgi:hypothetical protein